MLDKKFVRENQDVVRENMIKKESDISYLDNFLKADEEYRELKQESDNLRKQRNSISKDINEAKKQGKDPSDILKKAKEIPAKLKEIEEQLEEKEKEQLKFLSKIPNVMHESVPKGKDDSENPTIKEWGDKKDFDFEIKNHVEICEDLGLADFEASAKTSGNGFYFLEGGLALLNQALIRFAIDFMHSKKYTYIETPLMLRPEILSAAVDTDEFSNTIYEIKDEDAALIGTSEHSILSRFSEKTFNEKDLPKKMFSYSMCFRKEIGSHGINEKGLWRTHQFNKVEQFIFCAPEDSYNFYDELMSNSEEILQKLKLPYRVIEICTGDLASWKAKSADLEVYRPTTKEYGEVMSLSNCTDYQARDLNIRLERKGGLEVVHTLNNTALATSRIMVAIIENYQNKDGSITVPEVLVDYMSGKMKIIK
jgi:seryl-tRNA synthetase